MHGRTGRTHARTEALTDGEPENINVLAAPICGGSIKLKVIPWSSNFCVLSAGGELKNVLY